MAIGRGGIVPKASVPLASVRNTARLCVEDALTGRCAPSRSEGKHWVWNQQAIVCGRFRLEMRI